MSESRSHINLVKIVYEYVKTIVPDDKQFLIEIDSADSIRPSEISGRFIPDVQFWDDELYIIGEAKTINDFERIHSREQFSAYVDECANFSGAAILVIAVPWQLIMTARNYFRRMKKGKKNFRIVILNEFGSMSEI